MNIEQCMSLISVQFKNKSIQVKSEVRRCAHGREIDQKSFRTLALFCRAVTMFASESSLAIKRDIYHAEIVKARFQKEQIQLKRKRDIEKIKWHRYVRRRTGEDNCILLVAHELDLQ
jgi:hypothetical protein